MFLERLQQHNRLHETGPVQSFWGVWGVQIEIAPLTSGGSTSWERQEQRCFSSDTQISAMARSEALSQPQPGNRICWWVKFSEGQARF